MKITKKLKVFSLLLVIVVSSFVLYKSIVGPYYPNFKEAQVVSPDGKICATELSSGSDSEVPAYGEMVYLGQCCPAWLFYMCSKQVFGGYCKSLNMDWVTNSNLKISCTKSFDKHTQNLFQLEELNGTSITFDIN